jgi:hypothetical protein
MRHPSGVQLAMSALAGALFAFLEGYPFGLASDPVRLDEFLNVAWDKADEFPDFQEWDAPCFDPGIQRP